MWMQVLLLAIPLQKKKNMRLPLAKYPIYFFQLLRRMYIIHGLVQHWELECKEEYLYFFK